MIGIPGKAIIAPLARISHEGSLPKAWNRNLMRNASWREAELTEYTGHLDKMRTTHGDPVAYRLPLGELEIPLNEYLGRDIRLEFTGRIHCSSCGRKVRKTYSDGHCWPCTQSLAACDMCILKPETCHYHKGTCREPEWGEANCFSPHYVYLANSSGVKVGITRHTNIPTRWIDQGAHQALPIMKVSSRIQSGMMEVMFKQHVSDKTDWRKMLRNERVEADLIAKRDELFEACKPQIDEHKDRFGEEIALLHDEEVVNIDFPAMQYPVKIKSLNFTKNALVEGTLQAIKGQYLILSSGVINIRKFTAYEVRFSA